LFVFVVHVLSLNSHWMHTMYRCLIATVVAISISLPVAAQMQRNFPQNALRGSIVFGTPPQITLNDKAALLAPGSRIRNQNNMLEMSAGLVGGKAIVNYTIDPSGLVKDVWLLRKEEIAMTPWPATLEQAQTWAFDPAAQTWTRP